MRTPGESLKELETLAHALRAELEGGPDGETRDGLAAILSLELVLRVVREVPLGRPPRADPRSALDPTESLLTRVEQAVDAFAGHGPRGDHVRRGDRGERLLRAWLTLRDGLLLLRLGASEHTDVSWEALATVRSGAELEERMGPRASAVAVRHVTQELEASWLSHAVVMEAIHAWFEGRREAFRLDVEEHELMVQSRDQPNRKSEHHVPNMTLRETEACAMLLETGNWDLSFDRRLLQVHACSVAEVAPRRTGEEA